MLAAMGAADVLVLPSESESFGIVFTEAWMLGKPVVGSRRCGPVASLIDDGRDGFLCENPEEIAARLEQLFDDPPAAEQMGAAGRQKTLSTYTWPHVADRFQSAILEVV
jgi:glycosyltransferase involved in cell wall biosynthesis